MDAMKITDFAKRIAAAAVLALLVGWFSAARAGALDLDVVGTAFRVTADDGRIVEGKALVGAVLTISYDGETVRARIAAVWPDPGRPAGDVLLHDLQVIGVDGVERPLCNPGPDGLRAGFPIAGRTDASGALQEAGRGAFEFVCTAGAQGKCIRFGYLPWTFSRDGAPMRDYYNACVHMIRADYCGDGRTFTRDGTLISFGDRAGVNPVEDDPEDMRFEAGWSADGAVCVARPRIEDIVTPEQLAATCPRLTGSIGEGCDRARPDALLVNGSR